MRGFIGMRRTFGQKLGAVFRCVDQREFRNRIGYVQHKKGVFNSLRSESFHIHVVSALKFGNGPPHVQTSGLIVRAPNHGQGLERVPASLRLTGVVHETNRQQTQHAAMHQVPHPAALRAVFESNPRRCHGTRNVRSKSKQSNQCGLIRRHRHQQLARRPPRHLNARCIHIHGRLFEICFVVVHCFLQLFHFVNQVGCNDKSFVFN